MTDDELRTEKIDRLIERSSLGSPEAKAARDRTPPEVTDAIVARVANTRRCESGTKLTLAGAWTQPCEAVADNALAITQLIGGHRIGTPVVYLCEKHMDELVEAGLVGGQ